MNEKNIQRLIEFVKDTSTEELQQKLEEHNADMYTETTFKIIREELQYRRENINYEDIPPKTSPNKEKSFLMPVIVIMFCFILLAFTNPTLEDFSLYAKEEFIQKEGNDSLTRALVGIFGDTVVESTTSIKNYLFFTLFEVNLGSGNTQRFIGILNNFIPIPQIDGLKTL